MRDFLGRKLAGMGLALAVALGAATPGFAQSTPTPAPSSAPLSLDQLAPQAPAFSQKIDFACGSLEKTGCAIVLPALAHYSGPQGLTLVPVSSSGTISSTQFGTCPGVTPISVGMADGIDIVARLPQCRAAFKIIGPPQFPYFGYLIVASTSTAASLDDLVNNVAFGKTVTISDGKVGTGGQVTFSNMLATNPGYKRVISEDDDDTKASLSKVQSGAIDGYFVMDSPGSPLIAKVLQQVDQSGKPLFKFLDVRPGDNFYALKGVDGQLLYQEVTINPGILGFGATRTVSTDGRLVVNSKWAADPANAQAISILLQSADQAESAILAQSHSPSDWTGLPPQGQ